MKHLIPHFIEQQYRDQQLHGSFQAYVLFIDLSGFTKLTESLMQEGKAGAEQLSLVLNQIFSPLVDLVYQRGGFIPYFAGDAFSGIFLENNEGMSPDHLIETARLVKALFEKANFRFGDFEIGLKTGLSYGEVEWGIVGDSLKAYYFRGMAIDQSAESQTYADNQDIILDHFLKNKLSTLHRVQPAGHDNFYRLDTSIYHPINVNEKIQATYKVKIPTLSQDIALDFLPLPVIKYNSIGEFREVVSIFLSFKGIETHQVLNEFSTIVLDQIRSFSGYFKEIDFGDKGGLMFGFFGAPISFENNIERALEFIVTLQKEIKELQKKYPLEFRVGITSGTAYTGTVGGIERCQYAAVGNYVNLAARLMTYANWGEVLVDKDVQKNRNFRFKHKGDIKYKGIKGDVPTYILAGRNAQDAPSYKGKMVGREEELQEAISWIEPIFDGSQEGIAYMYGEAGIGKSRLSFELQHSLQSKHRLQWLTCRADQILKKPFNPFIYFLKNYFEQSPYNSRRDNKNSFEKNFDWLLRDLVQVQRPEVKNIERELLRTKSILAALIGIHYKASLWEQLEAKGRHQNTLAALTNLFLAASLIAPLVLELEDGHWYDESSKEFLRDFIKKVKPYPIFLLVTSRYRDDGSKPELVPISLLKKYNISHHELDLNLLKPNGLKAFAETQLEGIVSQDLWELLMRTTNGNPFYLEQLLEYFAESNLLIEKEGIWYIKDKNIKMSGSINSILMARIDRLSVLVKETVKAAAVIGQEFEMPVLSEIIKTQEDYVRKNGDMFRVLKQQVKTAEQGQIWRAMNELRYIFKHSLLREAAYGMQLHTRLIELHRLIGEAIEKVYADNLEQRYVDLAFHFEQAEEKQKTKLYLEKAGNYARRNYQNQQAVQFYDKLLLLLGNRDSQKKVKILLRKASVLELVGHWSNCEGICRTALRIAQKIGNLSLLSRTQNSLGRLLMLQGNYTEARQFLETAASHFENLEDTVAKIKVYGDLGNLFFRQGIYEKAKSYFIRSIELSGETRHLSNNAQIVANLGLTHMNQGHYDEGIERQARQLEVSKKANDKQGMATLYTNMGIVYFEKGDYDAALDCYKKGLALSEELGNKQLTAIAIGCIGSVYERKGDYENAMDNFRLDLELCEELGDKQGTAITLGLIGELMSVKGEFDSAIAYLQKNLMLCRELNYRKGIAKALNTLGDVYYYLRIYDRSIHFYDEAIKLTREINNKLVLGYSLVEKGQALMKMGHLMQADLLSQEALDIANELGNPDLIFEAKILLARVYQASNASKESYAMLQALLLENLEPEEQAAVYYHLFEILKETNYRQQALSLYEGLYAETPKYAYKIRLEKLR